MNRYIVTLLIAFASPAFSGGDHFPIHVTEIEIDGSNFSFNAIPVTEERKWMEEECTSVKVSGTYGVLKWLNYKAPISKDEHALALATLQKSYESEKKIYFGYIGGGLHKVSSCSYLSKGLLYENGNVYSIYHSI
ncbi:hypothetical protein L1F30_02060 [Simiduia sp. 21SJ11W-1]|uniref:hypothetical protein n=1 Tax=Simiduia sp. 21SJ11W-1 TaxID=2909669 RepID=UPI0020A02D4E|nr:hypothetical protein [Simiduia sp. 21SJ11W-1]UTA48340.1 hypothetical protein L1F30_02060 [Simiduia sp. 21SJ11W-1]